MKTIDEKKLKMMYIKTPLPWPTKTKGVILHKRKYTHINNKTVNKH
jgi:hypothetical protein